MITELDIQNFQSHKNTILKFVPGINVLTGPSDVGKSAGMRALKWVGLNRPTGDKFRRHHTKLTTVTLDGVEKSKTSSVHKYKVGDVTMKALSREVPPLVQSQLRLTDVNFQGQHDPYFLISDNAGTVARTLNKVADLQIIDTSLKSVKQKLRSVNGEQKVLQSQLEAKREAIENLSWVTQADLDYKVIEKLKLTAEAIDTTPLTAAIEDVRKAFKIAVGYPDIVEDQNVVVSAQESVVYDGTLADLVKEINENRVDIPDPVDDISLVSSIVIPEGDLLLWSAIEEMKAAAIALNLHPLEIDVPDTDQLEILQATYDELKGATTLVSLADHGLKGARHKYARAENKIQIRMETAGICPMCEREM